MSAREFCSYRKKKHFDEYLNFVTMKTLYTKKSTMICWKIVFFY